MDRRRVMQIATGAVALAAFQANAAQKAATASAQVAGRTPEDVAKDEDYWTDIRNAFTIDRNVINFNNGYCSPAPIPVQDAMRRYLAYSDMGPIQTMWSMCSIRRSSGCGKIWRGWRAAVPRKWRSPATPASPTRSCNMASISSPATRCLPPIRTIPAC